MKKWLLLFVCFCLFSSIALVPSLQLAQAGTFSDVGSEYWAQEAIADLTNKGIVNGYPDGTFKPENNITRAEFAKVISIALGYPPNNSKSLGFSDLGVDHWSYGYVAAAVEHELVKGYPDGTFQPNRNVTKAEVLTIIARAAKWEVGSGEHFQDVPSSNWAFGSIESCYAHEIVLIPDPHIVDEDKLYPDASANRAQTCVFVSRLLKTILVPKKETSFSGTWTQVPTSSPWPGARSLARLVFNSMDTDFVLAGGSNLVDTNLAQSGTWLLSGNPLGWTENRLTGCGDRGSFDMVYLPKHNEIVLFGGWGIKPKFPSTVGHTSSKAYLDDTLIYDCGKGLWREPLPINVGETPVYPSARMNQSMAYDPNHDQILLFGGYWNYAQFSYRDPNEAGFWDWHETLYNDLWAFDCKTERWREIKPTDSPIPDGRLGQAMAFDSTKNRIILFGGEDLRQELTEDGDWIVLQANAMNDTWIFDMEKAAWTQLNPLTAPPTRINPAYASDANIGGMLIFGGVTGPIDDRQYLGDTWFFSYLQNDWILFSTDLQPSQRAAAAMAIDGITKRAILFGGGMGKESLSYDDLWELSLDNLTE